MSPQRVDRLRALPNQQIARAEQHAPRLLLLRLHGHEAHRRPRGRRADRLRVGRVVLLPFHEWLHVDRRDQLHLMTELPDLAAPVVRTRAGPPSRRRTEGATPRSRAPWPGSASCGTQPTRPPGRREAEKTALRQIDSDDGSVLHWMPPSSGGELRHLHLGTLRCRSGGGVHPITPADGAPADGETVGTSSRSGWSDGQPRPGALAPHGPYVTIPFSSLVSSPRNALQNSWAVQGSESEQEHCYSSAMCRAN